MNKDEIQRLKMELDKDAEANENEVNEDQVKIDILMEMFKSYDRMIDRNPYV